MHILLKIVPPAWFFLFIAVGMLTHMLFPLSHGFLYSYPVVGIVLLVLGLGFTTYTSSLFSIENTEILPTSASNRVLITYGPYAYSRNPMYLGLVVALFGVALWVGTLPLYMSAVAYMCVLNFVFIPFEEAKLQRIFNEKFMEYSRRVRRWL